MIDKIPHEQRNPAFEPEEGLQSFPLMDYLQLLWFRKKLIMIITILVGVYGYIHVNEITDIYSATSSLMIGLPETRVMDFDNVMEGSRYADTLTELEILRSDVLAEKVVKRLNLVNHPEFNAAFRSSDDEKIKFSQYINPINWLPEHWRAAIQEAFGKQSQSSGSLATYSGADSDALGAIETEEERGERLQVRAASSQLLGMLDLTQVGYSNLIKIGVKARDPKIAAAIANDIPEAYIVDKLESRFDATKKANEWLTVQLADLETKVADSERAVIMYREQHGMEEIKGSSILDTELSQLNSQLIIAKAEKAEIDARLAQLNRLLSSGGMAVETASEVMSSALVQQLRTQEADALGRASELSVEYGPKHPRMLQVQSEIIEIRDRIKSEVQRIVKGLEQESEFAYTRVNSIQNSLSAAQGASSQQSKESIQLRSLEREAAANRALFETFLTRFKETSSTEGMETSDARVLSFATVPDSPSYPDRKAMLQKYILMGFIVACAFVLAINLLNPGLTSPEQVQQVLGEYVIGLLPIISGKTPPYDFVLEKPASPLVEALNSLKFSLDLSNPDDPVKAIQVTSSVPEEGKTSLAIALGRAMVSSGQKVILVDGDLRRSSIGKKLGLLDQHKGLSDLVVAGEADMAEFIRKDPKSGMDYMPTGTAKFANATDIFSSQRMSSIVQLLKSRYDLVIIDTPPVMAVADSRIIGRLVDKTLFAVRWDKTPRKVAKAALDQLRRADVDLAGVVLQQVDMKRYGRVGYGDSGYYYHHGRYGKYYSG